MSTLKNYGRGALLPSVINKTPKTRGKIEIKIYPYLPLNL